MGLHITPASLLLLAMCSMPPGQADEFPTDLGRWYVADPPKELSDDWLAAQGDVEHEWVVTPGKTVPRVDLRKFQQDDASPLPFELKPGPAKEGLSGRRTTLKVDDGWLVGFNAGEFGAGLWWFSPDGKDRYRISDDHVIEFFHASSHVIAITGAEHGGMSKGKAIRLAKDEKKRWITEAPTDLGESPFAAIKDGDGALLVVTHTRLIKANLLTKTVDTLMYQAFWDGLYPNSVAISDSGAIFIGMRHGVAKIEKKQGTYKSSWLLPSKEFADKYSYKPGFK